MTAAEALFLRRDRVPGAPCQREDRGDRQQPRNRRLPRHGARRSSDSTAATPDCQRNSAWPLKPCRTSEVAMELVCTRHRYGRSGGVCLARFARAPLPPGERSAHRQQAEPRVTTDRSEPLRTLHFVSSGIRARAEPHLRHLDTVVACPRAKRAGGNACTRYAVGRRSGNHSAELGVALASPAAVEPAQPEPQTLPWKIGTPATPIGDDLAEIDLGEAQIYLDRAGTRRFLELTQNPTSGSEMAVVALRPTSSVFPGLRVERDRLRQGRREGRTRRQRDARIDPRSDGGRNEERQPSADGRRWRYARWQQEPHYDTASNHLTWADRGCERRAPDDEPHRQAARRKGVMTVTLVCRRPTRSPPRPRASTNCSASTASARATPTPSSCRARTRSLNWDSRA